MCALYTLVNVSMKSGYQPFSFSGACTNIQQCQFLVLYICKAWSWGNGRCYTCTGRVNTQAELVLNM